MPNLPELAQGNTYSAPVTQFGGYNHNMAIQEGEWYDERGLSADRYPLFSVRGKTSKTSIVIGQPVSGGLFHRDAIGYIDGEHVVYDNRIVSGIKVDPQKTPKQCVQMGAYVCVFPDAVYFNTTNLSDSGSMGAEYTYTGNVELSMCNLDGYRYGNYAAGITAPEEPVDGALWLDTSNVPNTLKVWSTSYGWSSMSTVYVSVDIPGASEHFRAYDAISISGLDGSAMARALNADGAYIYNMIGDTLIIAGTLNNAISKTMTVKLQRKVPLLDYVCEVNNRLWGCHYGKVDGQFLNEIYACKLGDMRNWYCYTGLSTDSYAVSLGSEGAFTGCAHYGGSAVFFKEDSIHKVYGNIPASFQLSTISARGVMQGCSESVKLVGEYLYYMSRNGICAFDGSSQPVVISDALGNEQYERAVAGKNGNSYLICLHAKDGKETLFQYDTKYKLWHAMMDGWFTTFADSEGETYALGADGAIYALFGSGEFPEDYVDWYAESGIIGYTNTCQQYVSRFEFRMKMEQGAHIKLFIEYDSDGVWHPEGTIRNAGTGVFCIPVIPMRCDHFRIKLEGRGNVYIYTINKTMEGGSTDTWRTY